jgi:cell division protein FtsB
MGWFHKKTDPLSQRARALTQEIAALEAQIKQLDSRAATAPPAPRLRSTALPHGASTVMHSPAGAPPPAPAEPIFEEVSQKRLKAKTDPGAASDHFNDLGVRKYDLAAFFRRLKHQFRGQPTSNPKLVNYLAAGSIQGLRPMRYEKRVERRRFLIIVGIVLLALLGLWVALRPH